MPLLGLLLWAIAYRNEKKLATMSPFNRDECLAAACLTLMLLTRNVGIVFVPAAILVVWWHRRRDSAWTRISAATLVGVVPVLLWVLSRALSSQSSSHAVGIGVSDFSPLENLSDALVDIAYRFGPGKWHIGMVLLIGIAIALLGTLYSTRIARDTKISAIRVSLFVTSVGFAGMYVLVNLIAVTPFVDRYIWFVCWGLAGSFFSASTFLKVGVWQALAVALTICIVSIEGYRTVTAVHQVVTKGFYPNVLRNNTILPSYYGKGPIEHKGLILISPEDFPFVQRQ